MPIMHQKVVREQVVGDPTTIIVIELMVAAPPILER